jgi:hypothetical protein
MKNAFCYANFMSELDYPSSCKFVPISPLFRSSALLAQLGALVNDGIERLAATQGLGKAIGSSSPSLSLNEAAVRMEKRKHEVGTRELMNFIGIVLLCFFPSVFALRQEEA